MGKATEGVRGQIVRRNGARAEAALRAKQLEATVEAQADSGIGAVAEVARHDLAVYMKFVHGLTPARHHRVWIEKLTDLVHGRLIGADGKRKQRLLLIAPPGHAKSTICSGGFPSWYLGSHPEHHLLTLTAGDTQSTQFNNVVKTTMAENAHHLATFPSDRCRPDEARGWSSDGLFLRGSPLHEKDPAYRSVSYYESYIGARAHGLILDDPLTQKQAQSENEARAAIQLFNMTISSRVTDMHAWILAIMTRWSDFDLASEFIAKGDEWDVLVMPALGDADKGQYPWGEALWPEMFSAEWLRAKRHSMGGPLFACLYQGDPTSMGGSVFKSGAWFRPLPAEFGPGGEGRRKLTIAQFWDLTYSEKALGDYCVCITAGIDAQRNIYVLHVMRKRLTPAEILMEMVLQYTLWTPVAVGVEEPAYRQRVTRDTVTQLQERLMVPVRLVPTKGKDKVARALLPAARAEGSKLFVDREAYWYPEFESEMLAFPLGQNDDQVDALSGVTALLGEVTALQAYERTIDVPFRDVDVPGLVGAPSTGGLTVAERFGSSQLRLARQEAKRQQRAAWQLALTPPVEPGVPAKERVA